MSLLDTGPDEVVVYPDTVTTTDDYGNTIIDPATAGVKVRGRWQPSTTEEMAELGQQTSVVYRFISRDFPSGPYGRVTFGGSDWDIIGQPKHYRGSGATRHVTTFLKER